MVCFNCAAEQNVSSLRVPSNSDAIDVTAGEGELGVNVTCGSSLEEVRNGQGGVLRHSDPFKVIEADGVLLVCMIAWAWGGVC